MGRTARGGPGLFAEVLCELGQPGAGTAVPAVASSQAKSWSAWGAGVSLRVLLCRAGVSLQVQALWGWGVPLGPDLQGWGVPSVPSTRSWRSRGRHGQAPSGAGCKGVPCPPAPPAVVSGGLPGAARPREWCRVEEDGLSWPLRPGRSTALPGWVHGVLALHSTSGGARREQRGTVGAEPGLCTLQPHSHPVLPQPGTGLGHAPRGCGAAEAMLGAREHHAASAGGDRSLPGPPPAPWQPPALPAEQSLASPRLAWSQ